MWHRYECNWVFLLLEKNKNLTFLETIIRLPTIYFEFHQTRPVQWFQKITETDEKILISFDDKVRGKSGSYVLITALFSGGFPEFWWNWNKWHLFYQNNDNGHFASFWIFMETDPVTQPFQKGNQHYQGWRKWVYRVCSFAPTFCLHI